MKTRTLLLSLIAYTTAFFAHAAAPVVNLNSVPVQRPGTKLVDINYTLTLDAGQTAFVEMQNLTGIIRSQIKEKFG